MGRLLQATPRQAQGEAGKGGEGEEESEEIGGARQQRTTTSASNCTSACLSGPPSGTIGGIVLGPVYEKAVPRPVALFLSTAVMRDWGRGAASTIWDRIIAIGEASFPRRTVRAYNLDSPLGPGGLGEGRKARD